jgi:DNA-binding NarL/FixJ family response regulator
MQKIDIFLAESNYLIREGMKSIINGVKDFNLAGEFSNSRNLHKELMALQPNVLILDYTNPSIQFDKLSVKLSLLPQTRILALTSLHHKGLITSAINKGVYSHLLYDCDKQEITDAIHSTARGEKFFCGKIIELLMNGAGEFNSDRIISNTNCDPLTLSDREIEIVRLVAEGFSAKQIADQLCLSIHTVNTHRKNIMAKLNVNNTAGLVMYAIRENIIAPNKFLFSSQ